jgi:hypothetical protein
VWLPWLRSTFMKDHPVVVALRNELDPYNRAAQVLVKIDEADSLITELNVVRAEAIYEVYKVQGATRTARLFDRSRSNIHRLIRPIQAKDPEWRAQQAERAASFDALMQQTNHRLKERDAHRLDWIQRPTEGGG